MWVWAGWLAGWGFDGTDWEVSFFFFFLFFPFGFLFAFNGTRTHHSHISARSFSFFFFGGGGGVCTFFLGWGIQIIYFFGVKLVFVSTYLLMVP